MVQEQKKDDEYEETSKKLYVSETMRLQGEADMFTRLLEHERKNLLLAKDAYKNKKKELEEVQEKIEGKVKEQSIGKKEQVQLASRKPMLQNQKFLLNKTIGENTKLYE